jgi:hypothetical protein
MFVCCECCVLSGRGLCDELITRPERSYRLWCVVVYDLETSRIGRLWPALGRSATKKIPSTVHKACIVSEGMAPFILNFSSGLDGWSASRYGHFTPPLRRKSLWYMNLDGPQSPSWHFGKKGFMALRGFEPSTARIVA